MKMTSMMNKKMLSDKLELPAASGKYLPNRLVKASTTESLADPNTSLPNRNHNRLYKQWANGGCGMIITGNVMIDRKCREAPRNVVLDEANEDDLQPNKHTKSARHHATESSRKTIPAFCHWSILSPKSTIWRRKGKNPPSRNVREDSWKTSHPLSL